MDQIIQCLRSSENVLLASHVNPDGDAIGSLTAMGLCLDRLGKKTTLYNESRIPAVYRFLPWAHRIVSESGIQNSEFDYDAAVILDCGDFQRIGDLAELRFPTSDCRIINIDHHVTNTHFGDYQLIDTSACATAEIVCRLIKRMGVPITRDIAICIYTGIFTDTGSFRFSNTNKAAFEICDEMVSAGVEPYVVARNVYGTYSLGRIRLLNLALDSIEISDNGRLSMMTVTQEIMDETGTHSEDADGLINYARRIKDVKLAVLIKEFPNGNTSASSVAGSDSGKFHVSLRSDGSVDVAKIASDFGGGGHRTAAGFNIEASVTDLKHKMFHLSENI